ncbi:MAG: hypothetical protein IKM62_01950 [Kiritimatiellae bacterium]|nr:hypothetical protein [Kiritimatiellia bacterium]
MATGFFTVVAFGAVAFLAGSAFLAVLFFTGAAVFTTVFLAGSDFLATVFFAGAAVFATGFLTGATFFSAGFFTGADAFEAGFCAGAAFFATGFFAGAAAFAAGFLTGSTFVAAVFLTEVEVGFDVFTADALAETLTAARFFAAPAVTFLASFFGALPAGAVFFVAITQTSIRYSSIHASNKQCKNVIVHHNSTSLTKKNRCFNPISHFFQNNFTCLRAPQLHLTRFIPYLPPPPPDRQLRSKPWFPSCLAFRREKFQTTSATLPLQHRRYSSAISPISRSSIGDVAPPPRRTGLFTRLKRSLLLRTFKNGRHYTYEMTDAMGNTKISGIAFLLSRT